MAFSITLFIVFLLSPIQDEGVPMTDVAEVQIGCLNLNKLEDTYVFNDQNELWSALGQVRSPHASCGSVLLPDISFSTRTLIGINISSASCEKLEIASFFLKRGDTLVCKTLISPYRVCRVTRHNVFWFSVPKIPSENIKFEYGVYEN